MNLVEDFIAEAKTFYVGTTKKNAVGILNRGLLPRNLNVNYKGSHFETNADEVAGLKAEDETDGVITKKEELSKRAKSSFMTSSPFRAGWYSRVRNTGSTPYYMLPPKSIKHAMQSQVLKVRLPDFESLRVHKDWSGNRKGQDYMYSGQTVPKKYIRKAHLATALSRGIGVVHYLMSRKNKGKINK